MRHAARRFSLSGTAPPFRGGKVTATPYAPAALLVADRPFPPPRSPLVFFSLDKPRPTLTFCPAHILLTAQDKRVAKGSARKAPASQTRYH